MGRQGADPSVRNRVRLLRTARGLSQQELARGAGLTRQAVSGIEAGHYIPNTSVALRMARALACRVEELFHLENASAQRPVDAVVAPVPGWQRVLLAHVGGRLVAHPLAAHRALREGFATADGVLLGDPRNPQVRLLIPSERLERTLLVLGCDPSLGILAAHLGRRGRDARLAWLPASSRHSLASIARREAHLAGSHLSEPEGGCNVAHARESLGHEGGLVMAFTAWEQGFLVARGNPKAIRAGADLARPDVRIVNRGPGAGCRQLLDDLLDREGIPTQAVQGYGHEVSGHLDVARAVSSGAADVGPALRAAAEVYGLSFVPLSQVRFDLVIPRWVLDHPAVAELLEVLQSGLLRAEVGALPGYEVAQMGTLMADIPSAA